MKLAEGKNLVPVCPCNSLEFMGDTFLLLGRPGLGFLIADLVVPNT